jgi:tetratricopeptide (TPR) repeat protein
MGDWVAAAASWAQVRERVPHHIVGFVNGATAAREQGLFGQAEALLVEATQRFPDQAAPWIERAQLAQQRQDWDEASRRWAYVCERFPTVSSSFIGAAKALREQRRFDEASAMLRAALDRFPGDKVVLAEWCWVAQVARDWPEAERRWCILRQDAPDLPVGYTAGAVAFRELRQHEAADALINEAIAKFASERSVWVERAWLASARRDWLEAAKRWADVRARFPEFAEAYLRGAMALSESWDFGAAETLLRDALLHFPDDSDIAVEYAALALRQSQLDEAAARFAHVREKFPHCAEGHLGAATIFRNRFRLSEAAEVLEAAQVLLPDEPRLLLDHALLPVFAPMKSDRDPEETLRRLAILRERFPNFEQGTLASLRQLREAGQLDEAAALARETAGRSASSPAILNEAGAIAVARGELQEASSWYQAAMERFPTDAGGFIGQAQLSRATGRLEAAEAELRHVMDRFPGAAAAYTAYGEIAMQREDWAEAMARWSAASQRFPDDKSFVQRLFDVRLNLAGEEGASAVEGEAAPHDDADPRAATRDLVMQFESLGGRGIGCEFGMFQREFGAEPLGLLRWADMPFEGIVRVLESRFAGVGHPDNTEVFVNRENARPEYCTRDTRGFMFMRCFVYEDEMPMERMRKQALRRIGYLKDKLIEDLESGSKIFIWRCTERTLRDEEIARLHRAVRAYGDNMLMYVRLMDNDHENGSVELVSPGLMVGYMDRFKMSPEGVLASNPASASWLQLCRNAAVRWRETSI